MGGLPHESKARFQVREGTVTRKKIILKPVMKDNIEEIKNRDVCMDSAELP